MGESDATRGDAETICQEIRRVGGKDCTATFQTSVAVSRCFTCPGVPRGVYWVVKSVGIPIIAVNMVNFLDLPSRDGLLGVSIASGLVHVGSPRHCPTDPTGYSPVSGPGDLWRVDERPGGTAILGDGVEGGDCSTLVSDMGHGGHVLMVDYGYPAVMKHGWKIRHL